MDHATLVLSSTLPHSLKVDLADSICEQCPVKVRGWVSPHNNLSIDLRTDRTFTFYLRDDDFHDEVCRFQRWFQEYGVYTVRVTNSTEGIVSCIPNLERFEGPNNASSPNVIPPLLMVVFVAFIFMHILSYIISSSFVAKFCNCFARQSSCCRSPRHSTDYQDSAADSSPLITVKTDKGLSTSAYNNPQYSNSCCRLLAYFRDGATRNDGRLHSLDTFRGPGSVLAGLTIVVNVEHRSVIYVMSFNMDLITVVLMIFVNAGGGRYWYMEHAVWDHPTVADLPHPWFNLIMGMTIAVSGSTERLKCSARQRISRILSRFAKLFVLGLAISSESFTSDLNKIPILGVLQDLAILYLVVAILEIVLPRCHASMIKTSKYMKPEKSWFQQLKVKDCFFYLTRVIAAFTPMIVYLAVMLGLYVPECGRGYLGPGGIHLNGKFAKCTGGAASYVDRMVIGNNHLAFSLPFVYVYETEVLHDSYGLFCLLSQMTQVYLGVIAGEVLVRNKNDAKVVIVTWSAIAAILFISAWVLCNDVTGFCLMPLNRRLWSVTFILASTAFGLVAMIVLYACIEVIGLWNGTPFYYPGTNSVALYVGHKLSKNVFPFSWPITQGTHAHYLFMHLWQTVLWIIISMLMYRKKIFLRV